MQKLAIISHLGALVALTTIAVGCGGGGGHGGGGGGGGGGVTPSITSLNGSTTPASPTNVALEIVGTGFGNSPGGVRFLPANSTTTQTIIPATSSWSDTDIVVIVPASIAAPTSVAVTVVSSNGQVSSPVTLNVTATPSFSPSSIQWTATTPLPLARTGAGAAAVATVSSGGWLYVIGGREGTADVSSVLVTSIDANGAASSWRVTNPLPAPRAFLATAEADSSNSPVSVNAPVVYAIGGQAAATDAPGGTNTVYAGTVNLATGDITWAAVSSLPEARVGAQAAVSNGFLHVTGGLDTTGRAIAATASAPINANGTLGTFTESSTANLPSPVAFHGTFAFGGFLYVIDGDTGPLTDPAAATSTSATNNAFFAPIRHGVVGAWKATSGGIKPRERFALLFAFGQVMVYEGLYGNTNFEAERTIVNADGSLQSFNGLTGSSIPGLNTFNTAGVSSPILTSTGSPRFLLIGGQLVTTPATQVATVERTSAP